MIYFCADDYGLSAEANSRIENCVENGVLNKISVLPNGEITDFKKRLEGKAAMLSLHINLVEGRPFSAPEDIGLLVTESGYFKHSFIGLLALSLSLKRKAFEKQLYTEIQSQLRFWKKAMGEGVAVSVDSHQHTHMIPLVFKTLLRAIEDEGLQVEYLRIPNEPLAPYVLSPSLYLEYAPVGIIKQWLLKTFALVNRRRFKKSKIPSAYFMGVLFSGHMNEARIKKLLLRYLKLAEKHKTNIEIGLHPGYIEDGETLIVGNRHGFGRFYYSPWRKTEYDTLINFKL